jgi:hypothetical protein
VVNQHRDSTAAYRFNVREAIIEAGLVSHPGQITFVDATWASVRPQILTANRPATEITLVVNSDDAAIEFLVCEVSDDLAHPDAGTVLQPRSHRVPYGRLHLELDVITHLLLTDAQVQQTLNRVDRLPPLPDLPLIGEPDPAARIALRQWFQATPIGRSLLRTARDLLQSLQAGHEQVSVTCLQTEVQISRRQFETTVLLPAIATFNRELNHFLSCIGTAVQSIDRLILSGDTRHWPAYQTWLRPKCPNATFSLLQTPDPRLSAITDGLTRLILSETASHGNPDRELQLDRQRYDDYFVLHELLCHLPQQAITSRDARSLLEHVGIPAAIADRHLPALLLNQPPIGLIPNEPLSQWLDPDSIDHPIYQVLRESPLFNPSPSQDLSTPHPPKFQPKFQHIAWMRQYLYCLTMSTAQTFQDPLSLQPIPVSQATTANLTDPTSAI